MILIPGLACSGCGADRFRRGHAVPLAFMGAKADDAALKQTAERMKKEMAAQPREAFLARQKMMTLYGSAIRNGSRKS
jgi:hypothetical protein